LVVTDYVPTDAELAQARLELEELRRRVKGRKTELAEEQAAGERAAMKLASDAQKSRDIVLLAELEADRRGRPDSYRSSALAPREKEWHEADDFVLAKPSKDPERVEKLAMATPPAPDPDEVEYSPAEEHRIRYLFFSEGYSQKDAEALILSERGEDNG
jgi:hypothetical protein